MGESQMKTNERLVLLNQRFENPAEVISRLAGMAKEEGLVEELFVVKLLEREIEYPTGLPMPVPLAIPHISDGCCEPFVSIATLAEPVLFKNMDRSGENIPAKIVFLFGILDPKNQLSVLRRFARAFANGDDVGRLVAAKSPAALLRELDGILEGMLDISW
ncbi:MAG: PTS sugar transporter subunit IIA [Synergistaceae bacterium]|jgi:PTS system galactitol-specific IIA component|nr:PTS sugar transporter subunit IIA [Synergistaceae bacterium]